MSGFRTTCICPDAWCPVHAECPCGAHMIIDDPDSLAFCPECLMDRLPVGVCSRTRSAPLPTTKEQQLASDDVRRKARAVAKKATGASFRLEGRGLEPTKEQQP